MKLLWEKKGSRRKERKGMRQVSSEEVKVKWSASAAQMWLRRGFCVVVALMVCLQADDSEQQQ